MCARRECDGRCDGDGEGSRLPGPGGEDDVWNWRIDYNSTEYSLKW